jgi:TolB protein
VSELKDRFQSLDRVPAPDLWRDISRRVPADVSLGPQWRRVAVAALALVIAAAGMGVATWAFVVNRDTRRVDRPPIAAKRNGRIAFDGVKGSGVHFPLAPGERPRIYVVNSDGKGIHPITGVNAKEPAWSPDGSHLAFVVGGEFPGYQLDTARADGSGLVHVMSTDQFISMPTWSPDGRQIAVAIGGRNTDYDLYVMGADGSNRRQVTEGNGNEGGPDWSPDGTEIVFSASDGPNSGLTDLYVIASDGSGLRRLTRTPEFESSPTWSPDGEHLAFVRTGGQDHPASIDVMDADGTGDRAVFTCTDCLSDLEWSPDGTKLLFSQFQRSSWHLWVMNPDGSHLNRVDTGPYQACCADWQPIQVESPTQTPKGSVTNGVIWFQRGGGEGGVWIESVQPDGSNVRILFRDAYAGGSDDVGSTYDWTSDGSKLAFIDSWGERIKDAPTGTSWDVFTMNADGTGRQQVTHDGGFDGAPSWSPAGDRIAYASDLSDPQRPACEENVTCTRDIFVVNADGSGRVQLTADPGNDWQPDWSPDGTRLAFVRDAGDIFAGDIYIMSADGTNASALTQSAEGESQPRWSPDGTQIAFVREDGNEFSIYVMAANGSDPRLLATGPAAGHSVEPDLFQDYSWSPDGTSIAFASGGALSVVDIETGAVTKLHEDQTYGLGSPAWRPIPG